MFDSIIIKRPYRAASFGLLFVTPVLALFLKKMVEGFFFIDLVDEFALLFAFPYILKGLVKAFRKTQTALAVFSFASYLFWGGVSGFLGGIALANVFMQAALEIKMLIFFLIFVGMSDDDLEWFSKKFIGFTKLMLLASIPFVVWQIVSPESYHGFFKFSADKSVFSFSENYQIQRVSGVFWFSGQLAIFAGIATCIFYFMLVEKRTTSSLMWLIVAFVLLSLTFSRGEIASTILAILLASFLRHGFQGRAVFVLLAIFLLPGVIYLSWPVFQHAFNEYQLEMMSESEAARVVFLYSSFLIGIDNFPLGAGFGSFGGKLALVSASPVYEAYGFEQYWWYREGIYLTDTFWPHILGETGFFGLASLLIYFILIWLSLYSPKGQYRGGNIWMEVGRRVNRSYRYNSAIAIFILLLLNSIMSPNYYEIISFLPCMLLVVAGIRFHTPISRKS